MAFQMSIHHFLHRSPEFLRWTRRVPQNRDAIVRKLQILALIFTVQRRRARPCIFRRFCLSIVRKRSRQARGKEKPVQRPEVLEKEPVDISERGGGVVVIITGTVSLFPIDGEGEGLRVLTTR